MSQGMPSEKSIVLSPMVWSIEEKISMAQKYLAASRLPGKTTKVWVWTWAEKEEIWQFETREPVWHRRRKNLENWRQENIESSVLWKILSPSPIKQETKALEPSFMKKINRRKIGNEFGNITYVHISIYIHIIFLQCHNVSLCFWGMTLWKTVWDSDGYKVVLWLRNSIMRKVKRMIFNRATLSTANCIESSEQCTGPLLNPQKKRSWTLVERSRKIGTHIVEVS